MGEPDDGSPNVVVRLVSNVEQYTGTLHESVLNPSVAVERMDNYIQGSTETETTTASESTKNHHWKSMVYWKKGQCNTSLAIILVLLNNRNNIYSHKFKLHLFIF